MAWEWVKKARQVESQLYRPNAHMKNKQPDSPAEDQRDSAIIGAPPQWRLVTSAGIRTLTIARRKPSLRWQLGAALVILLFITTQVKALEQDDRAVTVWQSPLADRSEQTMHTMAIVSLLMTNFVTLLTLCWLRTRSIDDNILGAQEQVDAPTQIHAETQTDHFLTRQWALLTVSELRDECRARSLYTGGVKAELVQKLQNWEILHMTR
jgi:hypothetical protein